MGSREWKMGASREDRTQRYATSWDLGYVTIITKTRVQRHVYSGIMYQYRQGPAIWIWAMWQINNGDFLRHFLKQPD